MNSKLNNSKTTVWILSPIHKIFQKNNYPVNKILKTEVWFSTGDSWIRTKKFKILKKISIKYKVLTIQKFQQV